MMRVTFRIVAAVVALAVAVAVSAAVAVAAATMVVAADSPLTPSEEEPNVIFLFVVAMARDLGRVRGWHWDLDWGKA